MNALVEYKKRIVSMTSEGGYVSSVRIKVFNKEDRKCEEKQLDWLFDEYDETLYELTSFEDNAKPSKNEGGLLHDFTLYIWEIEL